MSKPRLQRNFTLVLTDGAKVLETVQRKGFTFRDAANKEFTKRFNGYDKNSLTVKDGAQTFYIVGEEFLRSNS